jgi:hypothetical protein
MGHNALERMINSIRREEDGPFIQARHKHSIMCVPTPQGERLYLKPGQGGLQGDSAMASEFGQVYEGQTEGWAGNKHGQILANDPMTGEALHIGTTMYADDISDINIVTEATYVHIIEDRNKELDDILEEMEMMQNKDKEEHMVCMVGVGSVQDVQTMIEQCRQRREISKDFGMMKTNGKYLGNISQTNGKTNMNVDNRISNMREAYYALQKMWPRRDVKLRTKSNTFKGLVISAGLSGMEAETATDTEIKNK